MFLGVILGVVGHVTWQALITPSAAASGFLRHEPITDPAVSASYPAGFFVESRVYLETASFDLVGKRVGVGYLGSRHRP